MALENLAKDYQFALTALVALKTLPRMKNLPKQSWCLEIPSLVRSIHLGKLRCLSIPCQARFIWHFSLPW